jgi:hypothetical protein
VNFEGKRAKNLLKTLYRKKSLRAFLILIRYSNKGLLVLVKYLKRKNSTARI